MTRSYFACGPEPVAKPVRFRTATSSLVVAFVVLALMQAGPTERARVSDLPEAGPPPSPAGLPVLASIAPAPAWQTPVGGAPALGAPGAGAAWTIAAGYANRVGGRGLKLRSAAAVVVDQQVGQMVYAKNTDRVMPIASITKLMTAMVVLDSGQPLDELITIDPADVDLLKRTRSRLVVGSALSRRELMQLALMASENRAAAALARSHPGGTSAFVRAMNYKADGLGLRDTQFLDATGLNPGNVSTAKELAVMVAAGCRYPIIRQFTTSDSARIAVSQRRGVRTMSFRNSNGLVRSKQWSIGLSKTGYINEAGNCLVMQATIAAKPVIIVLLDASGKMSRIGDANRIKRWMEDQIAAPAPPHRRASRASAGPRVSLALHGRPGLGPAVAQVDASGSGARSARFDPLLPPGKPLVSSSPPKATTAYVK